MRKLKKTMALVLALVFALSVMPMANAAPDFPDDASIKYKEAVDVFAALKIVEGDQDGNFAPARDVTRAEAATIIARMLMTRSTADLIPGSTTQFKDVAANHWASGAIAFCTAQGIIVGYPNGNFGPNDPVTAAQFAVMMMRALKIGDPGRWVGTTWQAFAIIDGMNFDILDTGVDYTKAATRDETVKYAFNGFKRGEKVDEVKTRWLISGVADAQNAPTAVIGSRHASLQDAIDAAKAANPAAVLGVDYTVSQFTETVEVSKGSIASEVYKLSWTTAADAFGRPGVRTWKNEDGDTIAKANTEAPVLTYTVSVTQATLFADLGLSSNVDDAVRFLNGLRAAGTHIEYNKTTNIPGTGRGTLTEVYKDGSDITIVCIETFFGEVIKVSAATAVDDASVTVDSVNPRPHASVTSLPYETTSFAKDDQVLYTASVDGDGKWTARSVTLAKSEKLKATQWSTSNFVAGGVTYRYSVMQTLNEDNTPIFINNLDENTVFFDAYGNVIHVEGQDADTNYAYIIQLNNSAADQWGVTTPRAQLVLGNGEKVDVWLNNGRGTNAQYSIDVNDTTDPKRLVTYEIESSRYTLTQATGTASKNAAISATQGNPRVTWAGNYIANADTLYIIRTGSDNDIYTTYTDFRVAPSMSTKAEGATKGIIAADENVLNVVYVESPRLGSTSSDVIFLSDDVTNSDKITTSDGDYWFAESVLRNGVEVPDGLKLDKAYPLGLYEMIITTDGISSLEDEVLPSEAKISYRNGVLTIWESVVGTGFADNTGTFRPTSDTTIIIYDGEGGTDVGTLSSLPTLAAGTEVTFFMTYDPKTYEIENLYILEW